MDGRFNARIQQEIMDKELAKINEAFVEEQPIDEEHLDNFEYFAVPSDDIAQV